MAEADRMSRLLVVLFLPSAALNLIPSYGIGEAVWLIFVGTLTYVAYRDIFERRTDNLPVAARSLPLVSAEQEYPGARSDPASGQSRAADPGCWPA